MEEHQMIPSGPGSWQVLPNTCPINPIHAALLRTGQVFFYTGSGNDPNNPPGPSVILNLSTGTFSSQAPPVVSGASVDLFCAGQSFRSDGSLMVAGGTLQYDPFYGLNTAFLFSPNTRQWTRVSSMNAGRWYPTIITLGNGRILAMSGLDVHGKLSKQVEIYSGSTGWLAFPPTTSTFPMYSHLFLLSSGKLFYSGANFSRSANPTPRILTLPSSFSSPIMEKSVPGLVNANFPNQAASVLLPPAQNQKVMIIGGGNSAHAATGRVNIVNLSVSNPAYTAGPSLKYARMHHNAVLLPDRTVFVCNGSAMENNVTQSKLPVEIYDPYATNPSWSVVATPSISGRVYHAVAVLLPDGRVITAGGNPSRGVYENRLEIYSPAYMSQPRPLIQSAPSAVVAGGQITIQTPQASKIQWVHLIRPMATTHSWDSEQRLVDLPISSRSSTSLTATVSSNRNLAPVGWYMLFITDTNRVPSVAKWIRVT
jgi:hypothetical protein